MNIAFTSCNHPLKNPRQPGWLSMLSHRLDALLLTGDNVYLEDHMWNLWFSKPVDKLSDEGFARYLHERYVFQWQVPEFRQLLLHLKAQRTPVLGTIDDHDFLGNDLAVVPATQEKAKIARVLHRQFIQACNAPRAPNYPTLPDWQSESDQGMAQGLGLATGFECDGVAVTILDNRSYREDPGQDAHALGDRQLNWLSSRLQRSESVQLVFSGSPLLAGSKWYARGSTLQQYPQEFKKLLAMYQAHADKHIVHIGGDLHYNDFHDQTHAVPCISLASSGMGSGWLPFSNYACGNYGVIEKTDGALRIRTFGNDPSRNIDRRILI